MAEILRPLWRIRPVRRVFIPKANGLGELGADEQVSSALDGAICSNGL